MVSDKKKKRPMTEKRRKGLEQSKEARIAGLKKAQDAVRGKPASPMRLAALRKLADSRRGIPISEEHKDKVAEGVRKKYEDPEFRKRIVDANRKTAANLGTRKKKSDSMLLLNQSDKRKQQYKDVANLPSVKEQNRKTHIGRKATEITIEKLRIINAKHAKERWEKATLEERQAHMLKAREASLLANPSNLELQIKDILDMLEIEYIEQYSVGMTHVDFYIPLCNLVLEIYGCYWHGCRCKGERLKKQQSDRKRECFIRSCGYNLYILWEHDMYQSREIIQKLLS